MSGDTEPLAFDTGRNLLPWDGDRRSGRSSVTVVADQQTRHRHKRSAGRSTSLMLRTGVGVCILGVLLGIVIVLGDRHPGAEADPSAGTGSVNHKGQPTTSAAALADRTADPTSFVDVMPSATPSVTSGATRTAARAAQPTAVSSPVAAPVTPNRSSVATPVVATQPPFSTPPLEPSCFPSPRRGHKAGC